MKITSLNELEKEGETVKGDWELDQNHELVYRAGPRRRRPGAGGPYDEEEFREYTNLEVRLKARDGRSLGVEVVFTLDFFGKDGELFLRLRKTFEESRAEAGVRLRF